MSSPKRKSIRSLNSRRDSVLPEHEIMIGGDTRNTSVDRLVKMSIEGKLNRKNAYKFDGCVIRDLAKMLQSGRTDFRQASASIDASVQLYAHRVDQVYIDTKKVAGDLKKGKRKHEEEKEEDGNPKKKKKTTNVRTLAANGPTSFDFKDLEQRHALNPLRHVTMTDPGSVNSLLFNSVDIDRTGKCILDQSDVLISELVSLEDNHTSSYEEFTALNIDTLNLSVNPETAENEFHVSQIATQDLPEVTNQPLNEDEGSDQMPDSPGMDPEIDVHVSDDDGADIFENVQLSPIMKQSQEEEIIPEQVSNEVNEYAYFDVAWNANRRKVRLKLQVEDDASPKKKKATVSKLKDFIDYNSFTFDAEDFASQATPSRRRAKTTTKTNTLLLPFITPYKAENFRKFYLFEEPARTKVEESEERSTILTQEEPNYNLDDEEDDCMDMDVAFEDDMDDVDMDDVPLPTQASVTFSGDSDERRLRRLSLRKKSRRAQSTRDVQGMKSKLWHNISESEDGIDFADLIAQSNTHTASIGMNVICLLHLANEKNLKITNVNDVIQIEKSV